MRGGGWGAAQEGRGAPVACRSMVVWFDVEFSARFCAEHPVTLTTDPRAPQTHWVQALLTFKCPRPPPPLPPGVAACPRHPSEWD